MTGVPGQTAGVLYSKERFVSLCRSSELALALFLKPRLSGCCMSALRSPSCCLTWLWFAALLASGGDWLGFATVAGVSDLPHSCCGVCNLNCRETSARCSSWPPGRWAAAALAGGQPGAACGRPWSL